MSHGTWIVAVALLGLAGPLRAGAAEGEPKIGANLTVENDEILTLAAYNVTADRIEDFGIRVTSSFYSRQPKGTVGFFLSKFIPIVTAVVPNTAAARAGLQPGERILKSEGKVTVGGLFSTGKLGKWHKTQAKKWAEVAAGKTHVAWTLEVETPATKAVRTVRLVVPTPPPHWGSSVWQKPEGRTPGTVAEPGPLAERSREILDNGIWTLLEGDVARALGVDVEVNVSGFPTGLEPTGYRWQIGTGREGAHYMFVTQFRGRTDVLLETNSPATGRRVYLTSPSGVLERAWQWSRKEKTGEVPIEEERVGFEHELDLWTTKVETGTGRWPFALKPGVDASAIFAVLAPPAPPPAAAAVRPVAGAFLKLRPATDAERAMFSDAYGKLGAEQDRWAYTERSRGLEDSRVIVTRVDPSKPGMERCVLLSIDGETPTPADVQQWHDDGGDTPKPLGDFPSLAELVDLQDLRVFKDESVAVVFELPIRSDNAEFPPEKFQALFRVNTAYRSFEEIAVKLRDSFRLAGVVKVTDGGLELRFETLDPTHPPQPVFLKAGGGVRILLVKLSRSFEATRTDFRRVEPHIDPNQVEPPPLRPN